MEAPPYDSILNSLSFSSGTLSPSFAAGTFDYELDVTSSTGSVYLTPSIIHDGSAMIIVNAASLSTPDTIDSDSSTGPIPIVPGETSITVKVEPYNSEASSASSTYNITVSRPGWMIVGENTTISQGGVRYIDMAFDTDREIPYVAFTDSGYNGSDHQLAVLYYDSAAKEWKNSVDATQPAVSGDFSSVALAYNSFRQEFLLAGYNKISDEIRSYSHSTSNNSWNAHSLITTGIDGCTNIDMQVAPSSNTPVVAYEDPKYSRRLTVKKYMTGWTVAGGSEGFTNGRVKDISLSINSLDSFFVGYVEMTDNKPYAIKYNPLQQRWESLTGNSDISTAEVGIGLASNNSMLHDSNNNLFSYVINDQKTVLETNEWSGSSWVEMPGTFSGSAFNDVKGAADSQGNQYMAYIGSSDFIFVYKKSTSGWTQIGGTHTGYKINPVSDAHILSMAVDKSTDEVYVAFRHSADGKLSVIKWHE